MQAAPYIVARLYAGQLLLTLPDKPAQQPWGYGQTAEHRKGPRGRIGKVLYGTGTIIGISE